MSLSEEFSVGEKADGSVRPFGLSDRAITLVLAGCVGVLLSAVLTMSLFLRFAPVSALGGIVIYLAGFLGMVFVTTDRGHWSLWPLRVLFPAPAALLVWWGLSALGL